MNELADVDYSVMAMDQRRRWANNPKHGPWEPTVLVLSGRGVRPYSILLLLRELMHQVWMFENRFAEDDDHESMQQAAASGNLENFQEHRVSAEAQLLPCHYFDFFYGSDSGGTIATFLGRMRMTVDDATKAFEELAQATYGDKRRIMTWNGLLRPRYDHRLVESKLESLVNESGCGKLFSCSGDLRGSFYQPRTAHTCCVIYQQQQSRSTATLCRTYCLPTVAYVRDIGVISEAPANWTIRQVIRAATPSFAPAKLLDCGGKSKFTNKDSSHDDSQLDELVGLRSIACYESSTSGYGDNPLLCNISSSNKFEAIVSSPSYGSKSIYGEDFSLEMKTADVGMDEWISSKGNSGHLTGDVTLKKLKDITNAYLGRTPDTGGSRRARGVRKTIEQIACNLVLIRRARAAMGDERWRVFSGT